MDEQLKTAQENFLRKLSEKKEFKTLEQARYEVPKGNWTFKCAHCHYFEKNDSMCTEFDRKVSAEGCCCAFEHKEEK